MKDLMELRKEFDEKINKIMEKYGYVDIDEGEYEAVTERSIGTVLLFKKDGSFDVWFYFVDGKGVRFFKNGNYESFLL